MKYRLFFIILLFAGGLLASCEKGPVDEPLPDWWVNQGDGSGESGADEYPMPGTAKTMVVAHRGGSAEAGKKAAPDNSIAALRYAMTLGCYASECDVYWTKDDQVVVAHADGETRINGLRPWESTLEEIRKAGKLANGETVPSLEDFLKVVMEEGSCTKVWIDLKNITSPSTRSDDVIKACRRSCEIIEEMKAKNFVEFICTGNGAVWKEAFPLARKYNVPIGWMANKPALEYASNSYEWANLGLDTFKAPIGEGYRTVEEFVESKVTLSVFNADTDDQMDYFIARKNDLKAICTNYPKKLIQKMK